ncbi:MAG: alpha/beta hydrolase [Neomegalonema sp.]|nr:alpha/beta hydrolase [Neomegalonema sp.]
MPQNGFVFIHGSWHDHHCWDAVASLLEADGFCGFAMDLPGAGPDAPRPACYDQRPLDRVSFASAPSPNANVTQAQRTEAVIDAVRWVNARTGGKAVIVGHSLGGLTVSPVAEAIPDEIAAAVYLTAYLLPHGMSAFDMAQRPSMATSITPTLLLADPKQIGARRLDPKSEDGAYRAKLREALYGDLTDAQFDAALQHLHPDEPLKPALTPSLMTPERFGKVRRCYVECREDRAIPIAAQREMIQLTDAAIGGRTEVHSMAGSHSPFYAHPAALSRILAEIARG